MIIINIYLKNLNRIEFMVTNDCTGSCLHCSEGNHNHTGIHINKNAANIIYDVKKEYEITSVMVFGGEALMYPETVFEILKKATDAHISKRQLITNGFFSKDRDVIKSVAKALKDNGVNDLLLSVDCFHQKTIPLEIVKEFAFFCVENEIEIRLNPAWLKDKNSVNPYNEITKKIIEEFKQMGIKEGEGNIIFPWGNAKIYLKDYFDKDKEYINPYEENPKDLRTISINPDGTIFGKSIYKENIINILDSYKL